MISGAWASISLSRVQLEWNGTILFDFAIQMAYFIHYFLSSTCRCNMRPQIGCLLLVAFATFPAFGAESEEDLFRTALQAHKQYIETVTQRCYFKFIRTSIRKGIEVDKQTTEQWQIGDTVREKSEVSMLSTSSAGETVKIQSRNNVVSGKDSRLVITRESTGMDGKLNQKSAQISVPKSHLSAGIPIWMCTGDRIMIYPLELWTHEFLDRPGKLVECKRVTEQGRRLIHIEKSFEKRSARIDIDPAKSFQIVRSEVYTSPDFSKESSYSITEVADFHEANNEHGISFPKTVKTTIYSGKENQPHTVATVEIEAAEIGAMARAGDFELTIPGGFQVTDELNDRTYLSGNDGLPKDQSKTVSLSSLESPPNLVPPKLDQPKEHHWLYATIAAAVVCFVIALALRRRARSRTARI